jgi:hypothetical protein
LDSIAKAEKKENNVKSGGDEYQFGDLTRSLIKLATDTSVVVGTGSLALSKPDQLLVGDGTKISLKGLRSIIISCDFSVPSEFDLKIEFIALQDRAVKDAVKASTESPVSSPSNTLPAKKRSSFFGKIVNGVGEAVVGGVTGVGGAIIGGVTTVAGTAASGVKYVAESAVSGVSATALGMPSYS